MLIVDQEVENIPWIRHTLFHPYLKYNLLNGLVLLGYDADISSNGTLFVRQFGQEFYLGIDEARDLLIQLRHPVTLADCLIKCEGVDWFDFKQEGNHVGRD